MKKFPVIATAATLCMTIAISAAGCAGSRTSFGPAQGDAAAPVITAQPEDIMLRNGQQTTGLMVEAYSGDGGSLTYQWYSNASDSNSGGTAVDGATKSVYIPDVTADGTAYYYCVITNTNLALSGKTSAEATSDCAEVTVYSTAETPRITAQPQGSSYVFGAQDEALPIEVEAAVSKGELTYQWFSSASGSYDDAQKIENANSPAYIPDITERGATYYFCEVTNTDSSASSGATATARTKLACVSIDYEYSSFIFEAIDDATAKLTAYNGSSLRPYIPETDAEGRTVTEIGPGVFAGTSIVEVTIPDTVTTLGIFNASSDSQGVFYNCSALQTINFGGHFTEVGDHTFSSCAAIQSDVWAMCDRLERLGKGAFQYVPLQAEFVVPATLSGEIGDWTFQHAKNIKNITFAGDKVTRIGGSALTDISTLESIVIPASVASVGDCLRLDPALKSVTFERSAAEHGSITAGVPFQGSDYPELVINVPEDSYEAYCSSLGSFAGYIKAPVRTLTVEGATIDGEDSIAMNRGDRLNAEAEIVYDNESWVCWFHDGTYYNSYADLAAAFVMGMSNDTIKVLYDSDFTDYNVNFTPSCVYENMESSAERHTGTHELLGELNGTRYTMDSATDIKIINGVDETHGEYNNDCPVSSTAPTYLLLTFKNNKEEAITIRYEAEYFGVRGSVTVELPANGTRTALLVVQPATGQDNAETAFHQLRVVEGGESGYDITIAGRRAVETHTLTIEGATIDGSNTLELYAGGKLDADAAVIIADEENNLGWTFGGVWYENYADLAAGFAMTDGPATLKAVTAEDFAIPFTPTCKVEDKSNSATTFTMNHVEVAEGVMGTRYVMEAGGPTYIKITNSVTDSKLEPHGEEDGVYKECPASGSHKTSLLMTFVNNGEQEITLRYEAEYFGIIGEVTVTLGAHESKTVLLVQSVAREDNAAPYHQMEVTAGGADGYDITVYGYRAV